MHEYKGKSVELIFVAFEQYFVKPISSGLLHLFSFNIGINPVLHLLLHLYFPSIYVAIKHPYKFSSSGFKFVKHLY